MLMIHKPFFLKTKFEKLTFQKKHLQKNYKSKYKGLPFCLVNLGFKMFLESFIRLKLD